MKVTLSFILFKISLLIIPVLSGCFFFKSEDDKRSPRGRAGEFLGREYVSNAGAIYKFDGDSADCDVPVNKFCYLGYTSGKPTTKLFFTIGAETASSDPLLWDVEPIRQETYSNGSPKYIYNMADLIAAAKYKPGDLVPALRGVRCDYSGSSIRVDWSTVSLEAKLLGCDDDQDVINVEGGGYVLRTDLGEVFELR
jgi:hypothetical protein